MNLEHKIMKFLMENDDKSVFHGDAIASGINEPDKKKVRDAIYSLSSSGYVDVVPGSDLPYSVSLTPSGKAHFG